MFELPTETFVFDASEPGEVTGEKYAGSFEVRKTLNPQQKAIADQERRAFLGNPSKDEAIDSEVAELSYVVGQLKVRVVKGPKWYAESSNLKTFLDSNVLIELANKVFEVELKFKESIKNKAVKAKEEMTK